MYEINIKDLYNWCKIRVQDLEKNPELKIPFRIVKDSIELGNLIAAELLNEIKVANSQSRPCRAIIPCGPKCWYAPFIEMVNREQITLINLFVFHMDECLDWEGKLLAKNDPYNFRTFMEKYFYEGVAKDLAVPESQKYFLKPDNMNFIKEKISELPIDITIGGWGQDGHIAYNQARRNSFNKINIEKLRNSELRIQYNNIDTILALAHRSFGAAYQFVPPMSITLGLKECLSAKKIRVYSDTGSWKQTALRVALFSKETTEYPITLLQKHSDAIITATYETARHPISENPTWEFNGVN